MRTLHFTVPTEYEGTKVLSFLKQSAGLSSRMIRSLKPRDDGILCNGEPIRTIDYVHTGDVLSVNIIETEIPGKGVIREAGKRTDEEWTFRPSEPVPEPAILYEDDDVVVVNKPGGLAIHQSHNHQGDTLADWMLARGIGVFRAVGRLDKGTSGIVVCARNGYAASRLQGGVHKTYLAIATGRYEGSGTIDTPIYRPDPNKTIRACGPVGESAVTHWTAVRTGEENTLLRITLETGRTHQIRVHFASEGTPLAGDVMYGAPPVPEMPRQALHCAEAWFLQPYTGEKIEIQTELPEDMAQYLSNCSLT